MKRFHKLLSLVLCIAMVVSVMAVAFTAQATAAETQTAQTGASDKVFSWDNASVYFLLTDRFVNGNTSNDHSYNRLKNPDGSIVSTSSLNSDVATFHGGDFAGITKKINEGYFDNLGVNALWISAPYEQIHGYVIVNEGKSNSIKHYAYHGYYALDYTQTDANFGTAAEFKTMVDTAHNHGIRIVLDIVMNHPGYNTLYDMKEYGYGALKSSYNWDQVMGFYYDWKFNGHYHEGIDYTSSAASSVWSNWWGGDWLRAGITGYPALGGDDLTRSAGGDLPDFRTENTSTVELPKILKNKWTKEGRYTTEMNKLNSYFASGKSKTVRNYLVYWLSQWVEQYGVDGFRCDTAKHVELASWKALKDQCNQSLNTWRKNNKGKTDAASWTDNFWMTAEDYGSGVNYDNYYSQGGFDSKINFSFTGGGGVPNASSINNTYSEYANKINTKDGFNVLTYISSHDTTLCRNDLYYQGSAFQLLPGAIQIFYGDESNRKVLNSTVGGEGDHLVRSDMNWSSTDKDVLAHWQKVGQFRNNHIAVGAGSHTKVDSTSGTAFARVYDKNGVRDTVLACIGAANNTNVTISVGKFIQDGVTVTNAYDKKTAVVSGGKVTFNSGAHGTILLETAPAKPGPTVSVSNTGGEFKTNTLSITATLNDLAKSGTYQIGKASPVTFTKTATFSIGANMDFDESVDVKYTATDGSETYTVTYTYTKVDPSATPFKFPTATTTYLLDKAGWGSANCYAWLKDTTTSNAPWPGESMKLVGQFEGSNVYEYDVTNKYNMVIFNSSSQTDDLTFTPYSYYNNSTSSWVSVDPPTPPTPTTPTTPSQPTTQPTTQHYTQPTTEPEPFTVYPYPPTEWTATPPSTLILGDTDFDSFVTITDATFIQKCLARIISFTDEQNLCGDITGDGLDITDATLVQKWLARFTVPYPIGQPIGSDPTVAPSTSTTPTQPIPTTPPSSDKNTVYVDMGKECDAYAYYWADEDTPLTWPGVAMNHVSGNVYSIEIDKKYDKIIFSENGGSQTDNLDIPGDGYIYNKNSGNWSPYSDQPTQPPTSSEGSNKVYVDMGKECNAYAHYWEDQGESPIQWPGVAMNHVSGNVYSIEIDKKYNKIIFNENGGSQTDNLDIPGDGYIYNKNSGNWSPYSDQPTQPPTGSSDFSDPDTLFVCDDGNWGSVYVHYWGSQETQWPGAQMNKVGTYEGSDLYSLKLPSGLSGIVINIGSNAQQSSDLTMPGAYKVFKTSSKSFVDVNQ